MTARPQIACLLLASSPAVGAGGFEPPYPDMPHEHRAERVPAPARIERWSS